MYLAAWRKLKVSVLSANFKKCRFCNFSGSYTKRSPSGIVTGASWVHFTPRKTKIGQEKSLTPFFHRALQLLFASAENALQKDFLSSLKNDKTEFHQNLAAIAIDESHSIPSNCRRFSRSLS